MHDDNQIGTDAADGNDQPAILAGRRISFVGKLASMARRDAAQLVRSRGAVVLEKPDASVSTIVVGEADFPLPEVGEQDDLFDEAARRLIEQGEIEIITETQLWHRLGMVESRQDVHRLYTPAMLADLLKVPVAVIRRWRRRGLIVPAREVRRLPYFDFQEVATARRLAELLAAGMTPRAIERKLDVLARCLPDVARPLAQLSVIVHGKDILLRQGDGLIEPGGQLRFDFDAWPSEPPPPKAVPLAPEQMCRLAAELEEEDQLAEAAEMYRAAMAGSGPSAEICFQLAELLYRLGDLAAARERYYMAIELDEDFVEARANLGCVLAETGQHELAVAAFQGALRFHPDYADVHYQLARTLDEMNRRAEAEDHWQ
ncbi:MAG: MerR family transcriptional regulator, partial [Pirellulaceae bacterium]|nr:MerR family transcriptional regulator [Pirellulaceae bacterium]